MTPKFIPITGTVVSHGNATGPKTKDGSNPDSTWTYSYVVIREDETGEEVTVKDLTVLGNLNQHVTPGAHGYWLIAKAARLTLLLGYRTEDRQTITDWVFKPQGIVAYPLSIILLGFATTITIILSFIGIPLLLFGIYLFFAMGKLPGKFKDALIEHDFELRAPRTI